MSEKFPVRLWHSLEVTQRLSKNSEWPQLVCVLGATVAALRGRNQSRLHRSA